MARKKWKLAIVNRRGWNYCPLNQDKIFHQDELDDFWQVIIQIKENSTGPVFMCGVSFGSCIGSRIMGKFGTELKLDGFVSISNPFNMARLAFWYKKSLLGNIIQRVMAMEFKKLIMFHSRNPLLKKLFDKEIADEKAGCVKSIDDYSSLWEID